MYHWLRHDCGLPVAEAYYPTAGGGSAFCVIRMAESATQNDVQETVRQMERRTGDARKYTLLVDYDIDPRDPECLLWALSFRTARRRDITLVPTHGGGLDPSGSPAGTGHGRLSAEGEEPDFTRMIINATRKWAYPPVALPKKPYMDRALEIWAQHPNLPKPHMRQPCYGYTLGFWDDDLQSYADLIVQGDYLKLGEEMEELQQPLRDDMVGRNVDRSAG
jgi:4-hydroxy-3-polyprenylbenzoate decarboxylase